MINIQRLKQFLITIYYLKTSQILWRIYYYSKTRFLKKSSIDYQINVLKIETKFLFKPISLLDRNKFIFLNEINYLNNNIEVNNFKKLWIYNLNYFDFLNSNLNKSKQVLALEFLERWLNEVTSPNYAGLDPYPTSLRIVNWIKFDLRTGLMSDDARSYLFIQTEYLYNNIEWHLLGNHVLANAKALIFSGSFFKGPQPKKWKSKGIKIYTQQIKDQILNDGGHFEKSPMYHSIILEDILDLINISVKSKKLFPKEFLSQLRLTSEKMLSWLQVMSYENHELPNFNDSTQNISQNFHKLSKYAHRLDIKKISKSNNKKKIDVHELESSGFVRIDQINARSFLDVGSIGASYIPGHAHADTLSFETSFFKQRFLVNLGISTYENSDRRLIERSTSSHNTVEVNKNNSSDVWSSFRVGSRASTFNFKKNRSNKKFSVSCSHDGYNSIIKNNYHKRQWIFEQNEITIIDEITIKKSDAVAHFILHPRIKVIEEIDTRDYVLINNNKRVKISVEEGQGFIIEKQYASEFGVLLDTKCICVKLVKGKSKVILSW
jgi:uncharacterized heparinase superfamily protein